MSACTIQNNLILKLGFLCLLCPCLFLFSGCVIRNNEFEPDVAYFPSSRTLERLPSAFPPLSPREEAAEWGRELYLGLQFAHEFDLYRAITCYKRALYLCPKDRTSQIEYHIVEAYYLGRKFAEASEFYEFSSLALVPSAFPALKELLLMLYDSYNATGQCEKAERMLFVLQSFDPAAADKLKEYNAVLDADFKTLSALPNPELPSFLCSYCADKKSVARAQLFNAILPGAGYFYVGQKKSAITSFVINTLFTYAAYQFFDRGFVAAGLITASLELGWYLGGINGAGLAAREWNERLYEAKGKEFLTQNRLFPVLMFQFAF
jgi:hypothetical protein